METRAVGSFAGRADEPSTVGSRFSTRASMNHPSANSDYAGVINLTGKATTWILPARM